MKNNKLVAKSIYTALFGASLLLTGCQTMDRMFDGSTEGYDSRTMHGHDSIVDQQGSSTATVSKGTTATTPAERQASTAPKVRKTKTTVPTEAPSMHSSNPAAVPTTGPTATTTTVPTTTVVPVAPAPVMAPPAVSQ